MSQRWLDCQAASVMVAIWLAGACGRPAPPVDSAAATKLGALPRQQLIEDARELAAIIEDTHPDPYAGGGSRIAFHRRLHQALNAIPEEGMTVDEFYRLLRPFVAGVGTGEHGAFRYSRLYFADRPHESLEAINRGRAVPLVDGDYDFAWSYVDGKPIARRSGPVGDPPMVKFLRLSPTFRAEYDAGTYSGYYKPEKVIVLCDAGTLSAGFSVVVELWRLGATTVGTPPAQAPNSYGAAVIARLRNSGIQVMVPTISAAHFPDDPSKAKVLPVDHPLTCERFASYGFDPNAEYLEALTLLLQASPTARARGTPSS